MTSVRPQPLAEGRFQLIEVIGEGGMATVYRAFDQRLQRPRAIKILSPAFAQRPALRRRFLAEAQTMANLENARVVRVFDMGEDGERVFIVMELVEGGSLVDRVRVHGAMPPRMATRVTIELCEAIHAAHEANVIHRDIKPHNVLLTKSGELRITDFGIAQVQQDDKAGMTRTGAVLGTWGFMAPEQKSNAKQVDARADIYSIGGTLWSLLKNDTPPELFMVEAEPEWYSDVPDPLAEVIRRATRYRREDRYPSARALADALRAVLPLLPEDPADTPDLVTIVPERHSNAAVVDTMAQLGVEGPPRPAEGTMVPDEPPSSATLSFEREPPPLPPPPPAPRPIEVALPRGLVFVAGMGALLAVGAVLWAVKNHEGTVLSLPPSPAPAPPLVVLTAPPPATPAPEIVPSVVAPPVPAEPVVPPPTQAQRPPTPEKAPDSVAPVAPPPPVEAPIVAPVPEAPVHTEISAKVPAGKLSTTAPSSAAVGSAATFTARIAGHYDLKLYYRGAGGGAFQNKAMSGSGGTYTAAVKVDESMAGGLEYFVAATDPEGGVLRDGSAGKPNRIAVGP